MEKFLSIPVTSEQTQLVSANNVLLVEQASTTTVTIAYAGGKVATLTHATAGSGDETQRDAIQNAIVNALQKPWTEVVFPVTNLPYAVSGIAVA
jgi:hypothetical protein